MLDKSTSITAFIVNRALCRDCIAQNAGLEPAAIDAVVRHLAQTVKIDLYLNGTCLECRKEGQLLPDGQPRILSLTLDQAEDLEAWLAAVVNRAKAPTAAVGALLTLREARYRALIAAAPVCDRCLASRTRASSSEVYEILKRIAETTVLSSDIACCDRCLREKVVHRIG